MANLKLSYKNVYEKVGEFLGIPTLTDAADITKCKELVKRGYRKFLFPFDLGYKPPKTHRWKFLEKTSTLSTESGTDTYKLPLGFSSFIKTFTYTTPISCNPVQKPLSFIYDWKSKITGTGYPNYFALKNGAYDNLTGQQYEVVFAPAPSATLNYYYTYIFTPPAPENDDDVFVGDDLVSEAILECALAATDLQENDNIGVHAQEAERLVQQLIGKDKSDGLVSYLGMMTNCKSQSVTIYNTILDQNGTQVLPAP
jgi:hypothetical protein